TLAERKSLTANSLDSRVLGGMNRQSNATYEPKVFTPTSIRRRSLFPHRSSASRSEKWSVSIPLIAPVRCTTDLMASTHLSTSDLNEISCLAQTAQESGCMPISS